MYPTIRPRYLPGMTLERIRQIPNKAATPVILPTGAVEQHGPHMPVMVDAAMGQAWLHFALPHLSKDAPVYVGPPITVAKSNEHTGFPGTLIISKSTLRRLLLCIARQLHAWGFRVIGILNTHGGNSGVLDYTLREIRHSLGMSVAMLNRPFDYDIDAQEGTYGFHAGEVETSWMLEVAGEWIRMDLAACAFPASLDDPGELRPESAPAIFSWATADLSPNGIMGDATKATPEKGQRWTDGPGRSLAREIDNLIEWAQANAR
jgi:creatinine amidohydrolase